jgi:disulfide bond formation protein DsbB
LLVASRTGARAASLRARVVEWLAPSALPLAAIVATTATLGSLYYSEVAHFVPCKLCWYQRIAMYPLALMLWLAVYHRDVRIARYAVPIASAGAVISAYHYQLERLPQQASLGCTLDAPCTFVWVWKFHFISIPFMALSAFLFVVVLTLTARHAADEELHDEDDAEADPEAEAARIVAAQQELQAHASR